MGVSKEDRGPELLIWLPSIENRPSSLKRRVSLLMNLSNKHVKSVKRTRAVSSKNDIGSKKSPLHLPPAHTGPLNGMPVHDSSQRVGEKEDSAQLTSCSRPLNSGLSFKTAKTTVSLLAYSFYALSSSRDYVWVLRSARFLSWYGLGCCQKGR